MAHKTLKSEAHARRILEEQGFGSQLSMVCVHKHARDVSSRITGERFSFGQFNLTRVEDFIEKARKLMLTVDEIRDQRDELADTLNVMRGEMQKALDESRFGDLRGMSAEANGVSRRLAAARAQLI